MTPKNLRNPPHPSEKTRHPPSPMTHAIIFFFGLSDDSEIDIIEKFRIR